MAASSSSELTDGAVLNVINKRLRALRKKHNRIIQMEEAIAQGNPINKEQEDVLRSKPSVCAAIDELEKLRQPLSAAVSEEVGLAIERRQHSKAGQETNCEPGSDRAVEDLLNLLYFGSLFDVKSQNDFAAIMYARNHERSCCLSYDVVTDDATDMLGERDLDLISMLGGLLISRSVDSCLSHKDAMQRCVENAKLWLANSDQLINPNANITYAGLRERLNKILASNYLIRKPELKDPEAFQVQGIQVDCSSEQYKENEEAADFQGHETVDDQSSPAGEIEKGEAGTEIPTEETSRELNQANPPEVEHNYGEADQKEQQNGRKNYQNQRGGRGGGRRGYSNGRGGRSGGRGGGYQNGRGQYYEQNGNNYYQRNYYNNRGSGGRGRGHHYSNHGHDPADVGVAS